LAEPLVYLNPSRIAVGAIIAILLLLFGPPKVYEVLVFLSSFSLLLLVPVAILALLIPRGRMADYFNVLYGVLIVVAAFGYSKDVRTSFIDGRALIFALFLIVVAVYTNKRASQIEF
jgi:hypothetical protein